MEHHKEYILLWAQRGMEYEREVMHIFESTTIHPTRVKEFTPLSHSTKDLDSVVQALNEARLDFRGASSDGSYSLENHDKSCIIKLTDFYEENKSQRRDKRRIPIVVSHGVIAEVLYDPRKVHIRQLEMIENIFNSIYKSS